MSLSSITHFKYDVFLSFRGDTRRHFTSHLYGALCDRRIKVFRDDPNLKAGDEISTSLTNAIKESRISIVVFSKDYPSSRWCLDELVEICKCMEQNNQLVVPIFYKVDPSDIRNQRNSYGQAMDEHENRFVEDLEKLKKVQSWRSALTEVSNLKGYHFLETRYFFHLYHFFFST